MNIVMATNTYTPHVGGVARSVEAFVQKFREAGHRVLVIAPEFPDMPEKEHSVIRVPAIREFNGSDFSVRLPIPANLSAAMERFQPDIIHSHHPFMLGASALRLAHYHEVPLVFTHHTMYERYTHYVPGDSPALQRFVIRLSTGYANLCDQVFAPSESVAEVLKQRGVTTNMDVVPTGVDLSLFEGGSGEGFRAAVNIPKDAFLVGHVGRLAPEKNLPFLARAVSRFLKDRPDGHFLLVGGGPSEKAIQEIFDDVGLGDRLHRMGKLSGPLLISAYKSMDVFAFASQTETQGMVLTEAMAGSVPVVAVDAPGAREVLRDEENGRLLSEEDQERFAKALAWVADLPRDRFEQMRRAARATGEAYSMDRSAEKALAIYDQVCQQGLTNKETEDTPWEKAINLIRTEWDLISTAAEAAGAAFTRSGSGESKHD